MNTDKVQQKIDNYVVCFQRLQSRLEIMEELMSAHHMSVSCCIFRMFRTHTDLPGSLYQSLFLLMLHIYIFFQDMNPALALFHKWTVFRVLLGGACKSVNFFFLFFPILYLLWGHDSDLSISRYA